MAKKIWYSVPLNFFWSNFYGKQKKYTPYFTDEQIYLILKRKLLNSPLAAEETIEYRELILSGLELWKMDSCGDLLHIFFLEKKLRNFLEKTPLSDLGGIRKYLYENGKNQEVLYTKYNIVNNCVLYSFGLHIPYEKNGYAFLLSLHDDDTIELFFSHGEQSGRISDNFYFDLIKKKDPTSIKFTNIFKLAINTIAYMKCFPECVSEGVPKITKEREEKKSENNISLGLSTKITDTDKSQKTRVPHFRKGHFKVLRSDYFKNKKGQIIYITETMVKGKAKTISTSPELDNFDSNVRQSNAN